MIEFLHRIKGIFTYDNIIYIAFASVFCPYYITGATILFLSIYILISKDTRGKVFIHRGSIALIIFTIFSLILAIIYKNYVGAACSVGFFFILVIGLFTRSVIRRSVFERCLNLCCFISVFISLSVVTERIFFLSPSAKHFVRNQLWFLNANYLATVVAMVIIICAYKVLTHQGSKRVYYTITAFNMLSAYLCGSLFVWVEILVGVSALLLLLRRRQVFGMFLLSVAAICMAVYLVPDLLPRISEADGTTDSRISIWITSITVIGKSPLIGRGFLTYFQICGDYPGAFQTQHAHNMILDLLLNFGVIGTALFSIYFISYFKTLGNCQNLKRRSNVTALITAVTMAALFHGIVDITIVWIQTGLFFILILGGIGIDERRLEQKKPR